MVKKAAKTAAVGEGPVVVPKDVLDKLREIYKKFNKDKDSASASQKSKWVKKVEADGSKSHMINLAKARLLLEIKDSDSAEAANAEKAWHASTAALEACPDSLTAGHCLVGAALRVAERKGDADAQALAAKALDPLYALLERRHDDARWVDPRDEDLSAPAAPLPEQLTVQAGLYTELFLKYAKLRKTVNIEGGHVADTDWMRAAGAVTAAAKAAGKGGDADARGARKQADKKELVGSWGTGGGRCWKGRAKGDELVCVGMDARGGRALLQRACCCRAWLGLAWRRQRPAWRSMEGSLCRRRAGNALPPAP